MNQLKNFYLQLFLLVCFAVSLITALPPLALAQQPFVSSQIISLDDCSADYFAPQSKLAYVGNSHVRVFHHASCQYTRLIPEKHRVYFDTRMEALKTKYVACKSCRP